MRAANRAILGACAAPPQQQRPAQSVQPPATAETHLRLKAKTPPTAHSAPRRPGPSLLRLLLLPPIGPPLPSRSSLGPLTPPQPPPPPASPSPELADALLSLILKRGRLREGRFRAVLGMLYSCNHLPFETELVGGGGGGGSGGCGGDSGGTGVEQEDEDAPPAGALGSTDKRLDATLATVLALLARCGVTPKALVGGGSAGESAGGDSSGKGGGGGSGDKPGAGGELEALAALWIVESAASSKRSHATRAAFWYSCALPPPSQEWPTALRGPAPAPKPGPPDPPDPLPPALSAARRRAAAERAAARLKPKLVARQLLLLHACGWRAALMSWARDVAPALDVLQGVRFASATVAGGGAGAGRAKEGQQGAVHPLEAARRSVREAADTYAYEHTKNRAEEKRDNGGGKEKA